MLTPTMATIDIDRIEHFDVADLMRTFFQDFVLLEIL